MLGVSRPLSLNLTTILSKVHVEMEQKLVSSSISPSEHQPQIPTTPNLWVVPPELLPQIPTTPNLQVAPSEHLTQILTTPQNCLININNKSIYKAQNLVHGDYFKHIQACACASMRAHTHTYTGTCTHEHLAIQSIIYRLEMDEDGSTEQKEWHVYSFGKRNVFRLHFNESRGGFC